MKPCTHTCYVHLHTTSTHYVHTHTRAHTHTQTHTCLHTPHAYYTGTNTTHLHRTHTWTTTQPPDKHTHTHTHLPIHRRWTEGITAMFPWSWWTPSTLMLTQSGSSTNTRGVWTCTFFSKASILGCWRRHWDLTLRRSTSRMDGEETSGFLISDSVIPHSETSLFLF